MIKLILAVDLDNAIGWSDGTLPWHIPEDLKRFKELTSGSSVVMGRKTFESLNRPQGLPNRKNYVLTSHVKDYSDGTVAFYNLSITDFCYIHQECLGGNPGDLWIIGGAQIYNEIMRTDLVDEVYITHVLISSGADVKIDFDLEELTDGWQVTETVCKPLAPIPYIFETLKKKVE